MPKNKSVTKKNNEVSRKRPEICDGAMTFHDCELAILRQAVDDNEEGRSRRVVSSEEIKQILEIVETFIISKKLVCYGGTAINNILPSYAQFYDRDLELPDYDFFSDNALEDAKELADIYYQAGYEDVEAKSGVHEGTFKVFVNYIPIADITEIISPLFSKLQTEAIMRAGILYAPPNYLRMAMFLELSRPEGDVTRWEKVLKRLTLLNKFFPLKSSKCNEIDFQRNMESQNKDKSDVLYEIIRNNLMDQGVVFFGAYATSIYSQYMPKSVQRKLKKVPDFDVLSLEIDKTALILTEGLKRSGFEDVKSIEIDAVGELVPRKIEVLVGEETLAYIYEPIACHSYNTITQGKSKVNIATIDTILTFYLSFLYVNAAEYEADRLLCMAQFLFDVQEKNRLSQTGVLKRFNMECIGKQATLEDMRAEKANKFKELKSNRKSKDFERWFLRYVPVQLDESREDSSKSIEPTPSKKTIKKKPKKTNKTAKANKSAKTAKKSNGVLTRIQKLLK